MSINLLIDIGNSRIKLAESKGKLIRNAQSFEYRKSLFSADLKVILRKYLSNKKFSAAIVSTVIKKEKAVRSLLKNFNIYSYFVSDEIQLPIRIEYDSGLGADRICSSSGAYITFKHKQILVVDYGTATTFNLIINGVFIGGLITPGINTALNSLIKETELPSIKVKEGYLIEDNPKDSISSGIFFQSYLSTAAYINLCKQKYSHLKVIGTGGASELFKRKKLFDHLDKNLTLKGLNYISAANGY